MISLNVILINYCAQAFLIKLCCEFLRKSKKKKPKWWPHARHVATPPLISHSPTCKTSCIYMEFVTKWNKMKIIVTKKKTFQL